MTVDNLQAWFREGAKAGNQEITYYILQAEIHQYAEEHMIAWIEVTASASKQPSRNVLLRSGV